MPISHVDFENIQSFIARLNKGKHKHDQIKQAEGWENFCETQILPEALVLDVPNEEGLQEVMRYIYSLNVARHSTITLRAAAGGNPTDYCDLLGKNYSQSYSLSACVEADIIVRLVGSAFQKVEKSHDPTCLVVGASARMLDMEKIAYHTFGRSFATGPLLAYATSGGAATGTHGTGWNQPSFPLLKKRVKFCLPNGEIKWLDRRDIKRFQTIMGAHLGLFGIEIEAEIETRPAAKLKCTREVMSPAEALEHIRSGKIKLDEYTSIFYNPNYDTHELTNRSLRNVELFRFEPVPLETPDSNSHPDLSHFTQDLQMKLEEGLSVFEFLSHVPELIPDFNRYILSRSAMGTGTSTIIGPWPTTMHYQYSYPNRINDVDMQFPISEDCHEAADAFEMLIHTLGKYYTLREQCPVTLGAYLRFFAGGKSAGLSPSSRPDGKHVCGFDIVSTPGLEGFEEFRAEMVAYFINSLQGKPHWGKFIPEGINFDKMYGQDLDDFRKQLRTWYDQHHINLLKSPLLNQFAKDILDPSLVLKNKAIQSKGVERVEVDKYAMAKKFASKIEGDSEHAVILREKLLTLAKQKHEKDKGKGMSLFSPRLEPAKKEKAAGSKRGCALL